MKNPDPSDDIPDFLKGLAANKPDNGLTRFDEMRERLRKRIKDLNDKIQAVNTAKNE